MIQYFFSFGANPDKGLDSFQEREPHIAAEGRKEGLLTYLQ